MNQTIRVFIKYSWHLHGVTSREMTNRAPYNLGKKNVSRRTYCGVRFAKTFNDRTAKK